jgi:O-antigen/teichoic acid export membrane protein
MLLPTLVERREGGDYDGFDRSLVDTVRYMVVALLGLAAAIGGAAVGVMQVFGPGFDAAANALVLLMIVPALNAVGSGQEQALYAVNRPFALSVIEVTKLLLAIGVTVALGIAFGATGVAAALLITAAVAALLYGKLLGRYMSSRFTRYWSVREIAVLAASYGVGFASARALDSALGGHVATLLAIVVGALVYAAVFAVFGGLNARDRERAGRVLGPRLRRFRAAKIEAVS